MLTRVIAIGGSAGSIEAVRTLCETFPADLPAAVCLVIHVGARGNNLIAGIFDKGCPLPVTTAVDGEKLEAGHIYVAAADHHLIVIDDTIRLGRGPRENLARPAIDPLFRSVALSHGSGAVGVVLTGMLNDGAAGLADLKRCGGITVVQNPIEAREREMPLAALAASDVDYQTTIGELGSLLKLLVSEPRGLSPPPARRHPIGGRDRSGASGGKRRYGSNSNSGPAVVPGLRRRALRDETLAAAQVSLPGWPRLYCGNARNRAGGLGRRGDPGGAPDRGGTGDLNAEDGGRSAPRRPASFRRFL